MLSVVALAALATFSPSQAGSLNIANVRHTYRELGPVRADHRYLPGDVAFIAFDIEGLKVSDDGRIAYGMGMEVLDKVGLAIQKFPPARTESILPLGGSKLPAYVYVPITDLQPGTYTVKVNVTDAVTNASKVLEEKFEVLPIDFGIVGLYVALDDQGSTPCGTVGVVGQTVFVFAAVTGFGRDPSGKPNAAIEFQVFDESGRPTVPQARVFSMPRELPARVNLYPIKMPLPLNREGSFMVELKAADKVTGKTASLKFPVKVHPASK